MFNVYDESPEGHGLHDLLILTEMVGYELAASGQDAIARSFPIILPVNWKLIEAATFPHYLAEMTTNWSMQVAAPRITNNGLPEGYQVFEGRHPARRT